MFYGSFERPPFFKDPEEELPSKDPEEELLLNWVVYFQFPNMFKRLVFEATVSGPCPKASV